MKKSIQSLVKEKINNAHNIKGGHNNYGERQEFKDEESVDVAKGNSAEKTSNNGYEGRQEVPMEEWVYVAKG